MIKVKQVTELMFGPCRLLYKHEYPTMLGVETEYVVSKYTLKRDINKYYGDCDVECISADNYDGDYDEPAVEIYVDENREEVE